MCVCTARGNVHSREPFAKKITIEANRMTANASSSMHNCCTHRCQLHLCVCMCVRVCCVCVACTPGSAEERAKPFECQRVLS